MAVSTEELTLLLKARNLANADVEGLRRKIETSSKDIEGHFNGIGDKLVERFHRHDIRALGTGITNSILAVATGGSVSDVIGQAGLALAGGLASSFVARLLERLASSTLVTTLLGTLTTLGTTLGGFISAAIPVGMALLPVLLVAALVAAVVFLIANPEITRKIADVAGSIVSGIVNGLAGLGAKVVGLIIAAPGVVASVVGGFVTAVVGWFLGIPGKLVNLGVAIVTTIVGGLITLPGKIADVVREAFANLRIDVGPFHISGRTGVTIDLPNIGQDPRFAGWTYAQAHGYAPPPSGSPRAAVGGSAGVRIHGVTEAQLLDMVERGLYFRLQAAAPTLGRT